MNCYIPMNQLILDLIRQNGQAFKVSFSISGLAIEQFERYAPEVLDSFRRLSETGCVEFLAETYNHSLASLKSKDEFVRQVKKHAKKVEDLFYQKPVTFRNTELIYSDGIGEMVAEMGFQTMLTEGAKHVLGWKSPNFMYTNAINPKLKILLRNFRLSDDISFRFSERAWSEWPLTANKFVGWLNQIDSAQEVVNIFMDYETFGEHQKAETGIFEFMRSLPSEVMSGTKFSFHTPSELTTMLQPVSAIHVPYPISWADEERDLTAWLGNDLQDQAFDSLFKIEAQVKASDDPQLWRDWDYLQASDHFYYMCTKWFTDGEVHKYFNPYPGAYEAFINYMNVVSDFQRRVKESGTSESPRALKAHTEPVSEILKPEVKKTASARWSDLSRLSDEMISKLVKDVGIKVMSVALLGSSKALLNKMSQSLPKRTANSLAKNMAELAKASLTDRRKAKQKVLEALTGLKSK